MIGARVAPTPKDTVFRDGRGSLYRFRNAEGQAGRPSRTHAPVLLVPSMIQRWYVLDLREGASLVSSLTRGTPWETFCFDWGIPEDEDRYLEWDDIVARIDRMVRRVKRITGAPKVSIAGYSIGGTLSTIYAAQRPESVASLVNIAGPIDFAECGLMRTLTDPRWFDPEMMTAAGNFSALQMQAGFMAVAPLREITKWVELANGGGDPDAWDAFTALETWAAENIPFPGKAYVTYVKELYQENRLVRGEHWVRGERVDLANIRCPVLSIVGDRDKVCPKKAVVGLNAAVGSSVKDVLEVPGGHVGAVVGTDAPKALYPQLVDWFTRNTSLVAPVSSRSVETRSQGN